VAIRSVTGEEENIAKFCVDLLRTIPDTKVSIEKVEDKRFNVLAVRGVNKAQNVLLYGHIDTVPVTDGWKHDPFGAKIVGDKLYGLGSFDMKGGVAAILDAFAAVEPKNISVTLAFTVDEEAVGKGCEVFLKSYDFKNTICAICCEPGFGYGLQGIVTGRSGWGVMEIEITQPSKHFIQYSKSSDMALVFAKVTEVVDSFSRFESDGGKQFLSLAAIDMDCKGMSLAEKLFAKYECSILLPDDGWSLATKIEKKLNEVLDKEFSQDIAVDVVFKTGAQTYYSPYKQDTNNIGYKSLAKAIKTITKKEATPYFRPSVSDENILAAHGIYTLGIGPSGDNAHGADEWVSISSVEDLGKILTKTITDIDILAKK